MVRRTYLGVNNTQDKPESPVKRTDGIIGVYYTGRIRVNFYLYKPCVQHIP